MSQYLQQTMAIIPARSGSKSVVHKNIRSFHGRPLLAHSIEQALACPEIDRVVVSTDSEHYAAIARDFGAEVPFLRPSEISGDESTDLECFRHCLGWFASHEPAMPDAIVHLRPTHPNRSVADIGRAIRLLREHPEWDSVRSVAPAEPAFKMWFLRPNGRLEPVVQTDIPEAHSRPRQTLPVTYLQNASIDVIRSRIIVEQNSVAGDAIGAFVMDECHDIDTAADFDAAESAFWRQAGLPTGKTFVFDIDGVIATLVSGNNYAAASPIVDMIARINRLHAAGNRIVLFTARGSATGIDWTEVTRRQMAAWGVRHDALLFGKPAADYYVDDRMLSLAALADLDRIAESPADDLAGSGRRAA